MRRFFLNNPPRWLARALAIVNGNTQTEIEDTLYPVVEVVQGGWGVTPTIRSFQVDGALGSLTLTTIACSEFETKLVQVEQNNPDTAANSCLVRLRVGTGVSVTQVNHGAPAGTSHTWQQIGGAGRRWFFVPPGCSLEVTQQSYTTTAGYFRFIEVTLPAGSNLS